MATYPNIERYRAELQELIEYGGSGNESSIRRAFAGCLESYCRDHREKLKLVEIDPELMRRSVNEGFSGGEKKRNEMLQMLLLNPALALLDETDSGLDIDALRTVAEGVNQLRNPELGILLITHYTRILNYIEPDTVHVMLDGAIVRSGGPELAHDLEEHGYDLIRTGAGSAVAPASQ